MLSMPKYWNSPFYDRAKNQLSNEAPKELKKEFNSRTSQETVNKNGLTIVKKY